MHGSIVQIFEKHFFIEIKIVWDLSVTCVCRVASYVRLILNCSIVWVSVCTKVCENASFILYTF